MVIIRQMSWINIKLQVSLGSGESDATAASDGTQFQTIKLEDDDTPIKLGFA